MADGVGRRLRASLPVESSRRAAAVQPSDLVRWERPLTSVALALVDGETPTVAPSAGGGALPGVAEGPHDLTQVLLKRRRIGGVSAGSRSITASVSGPAIRSDTSVRRRVHPDRGFLNEWWRGWPAALELRVACRLLTQITV